MVAYLDYTRNQESPILFHVFTAIQLSCAGLGRRVWIAPAPEGYSGIPIYPNSYTVLVGPSGKVFKSSCIRWGVSILSQFNTPIIRDKLTPQYLLKYLSESPEALIVAPELKTFIGTDAFVSGLAGILTNLHDSPDYAEYRTKGSGKYYLVAPCVNILGGSTPEWLVTGTPADATSGGFSARFLYIVQESSPRVISFPFKDPKQVKLVEEVFFYVTGLQGEIPLGQGVWEWYDAWYSSYKEEVKAVDDERTLSYYSRKHTHLWKVAIGLMAMRGGRTLEVVDLETADQCLRWAEITLPLAFRCITYSTSTRLVDRIVEKLAKSGGELERSELLYDMILYADALEVDGALSTLRQSGVIASSSRDGKTVYKLLKPVEEVLRETPSEEVIYEYFRES